MGRTVKISELKTFDIYYDVLMNDGQKYMYLGDRWFCLLNRPQETFQLLKMDFFNCEAELLGRMEFKQEETIAKHICDNRCLDDNNGHHCWPAP